MHWFKKHVDTVIVLGGILGSVMWMNGKFTQVEQRFSEVERRFSSIDNRLTKIETVMIIKNIMPQEMCTTKVEEKNNKKIKVE